MAKVINRSSHDLELYGLDSALGAKRWILPGRQGNTTLATAASFNCQAIRAPAWSLTEIFGSDDWWELLSAEVYAYDYGLFDVSLHCIPPTTPKGYREFNASVITIPLDESVSLTQAGPSIGPRDGELDSKHPIFGKFVRTGDCISVRVKPCRSPIVSKADLDAQTLIWKPKIEQVWNNAPTASSGTKFKFECDWVEASPHYRIVVFETVKRASMFTWSLDMDDRPDPTGGPSVDNLITCAHEFGHFLGLTDGYVRDGELPHLFGANSPLRTDPKLSKKKMTFDVWTRIVSHFFSNEERAFDRIHNQECHVNLEMMTWQTTVVNKRPTQNPFIPPEHVDIIDQVNNETEHKTQSLCWRPEYFENA